METSYTIKPKYDWIHILEEKVSKDKYGFVGEVAWNTDRNKTIQRISSIHLNEYYRFKKLFVLFPYATIEANMKVAKYV